MSPASVVIIGLDCATRPEKIGLARAVMGESDLAITDVARGNQAPVWKTTAAWLRGSERALLALDAPLGWSSLLAESLPHHAAGQRLVGAPDRLFHRLTDDFVQRTIHRCRPLEVGADRIARTAHATLEILDRIRTATKQDIPLAWTPDFPDRVAAIEVYPAATLRARGFVCSGYKRFDCADRRTELLAQVAPSFSGSLDPFRSALVGSAHLLDAVICALAGADFLRGDAVPPDVHPEIARKEGWIWVHPIK